MIAPSASCGDSPCTWWDDVYASDACLAYTKCVDPTSTFYNLNTYGLIGGTAVGAGQEINKAASAFVPALFQDPLGNINWASVGMVAIGVVLAYKLLSATGQVAGEYYTRRMQG